MRSAGCGGSALSGVRWLHLSAHVASQKRLCLHWAPAVRHPLRAFGLPQAAHMCVYRRPPSGRGSVKSSLSWLLEMDVSQVFVSSASSSDVSEWSVSTVVLRRAAMRTSSAMTCAVLPAPMIGLWWPAAAAALAQSFLICPYLLQAPQRLPGVLTRPSWSVNDTVFSCCLVCPSSSDVWSVSEVSAPRLATRAAPGAIVPGPAVPAVGLRRPPASAALPQSFS